MTYQVLARKWRPQDFSSLVGQEHVVTALGNGLREGRIAQAYLFSGIRGVGKTTAARVLAKALNCEKGPQENPCNECPTCTEITDGHSLDVIEVDAATYSKVEQVRELTETLRYGPARGRYKVVVLDEVHRLSRQAFDALLKIVEEPPAHLVFIFATTEIDAVPATILSRCQEFQFRRVPSPVLAAHLRTLCDAEEITASDAALRMIARAGEGSVRDSVALLDQMSTFGSGTISDAEAQQLLGGLDTAIFQQLIASILGGESLEIVRAIREIEANGWDPHNVYSQFLLFLRDALHLALGGDPSGLDLPEEEATALLNVVKPHGYESVLQVLQLLIEGEGNVRRSETSLLALEIAWLRAAELPKVSRIQDLLSGGAAQGGAPPAGAPGGGGGGRPTGPPQAARALPADSPAKQLVSRPPDFPENESMAVPGIIEPTEDPRHLDSPRAQRPGNRSFEADGFDPQAFEPSPSRTGPLDSGSREAGFQETRPSESDLSDDRPLATCDPARLPDLLDLLGSRRQSLAAHFQRAGLRFDRRTLLITPPGDDRLLSAALGRPANVEALEEALERIWGEAVDWRLDGAAAAPARPRNGSAAASRSHAAPERRTATRSRPSNEGPRGSRSGESRRRPSWESGPGSEPQSSGTWVSQDAWGPEDGRFQGPPPAADWSAPQDMQSRNPALAAEQVQEAAQQPVVRSVLEIFGGNIQRIEDASGERPQ